MPNISLKASLTTAPLTISFGGDAASYTFMAADTGNGPGVAVATGFTAQVSSFLGPVSDFSSGSAIDGGTTSFSAFSQAATIPYSAADDFIGLSFTLADGVHYGYAEVDGAELVGYGYNATATATSTTGERDAGSQPGLVQFTDPTSHQVAEEQAQPYTGPTGTLQAQFIWSQTDSVAIRSDTPNTFLQGGANGDALQATSGSNVLDGGTGSNFLVGATGADGGTDSFIVDGRGSQTTWSSIVNFHHGDTLMLWGFVSGTSTPPAYTLDGAAGYQGATIHSELGGLGTGVNESLTFAGINTADAASKFTVSAGTSGATPYLSIVFTG